MTDIAIVGAGAAGLAAAIFLRRLNPRIAVTVVDGAARPGAKILVSGGSRCNVTNVAVSERDFHGGRKTIIRRVLRAFPVDQTIAFFEELGVALHVEEHGKLFPNSSRSRDVLDALLRELHARGAQLQPSTRVTALTCEAGGFTLQTSKGPIRARLVVLATGGQSLPKSGSDGLGYELARSLGHTIVPTTPALVPLVLRGTPETHDLEVVPARSLHGVLSGVSQDLELSIWIDGAVAERVRGSLLWTHFGVSGPAVLDASRTWLRARLEGRRVDVTASFTPGEAFEAIDGRWTRLAAERPRASVSSVLATMVPASVAAALLDRLAIDGAIQLARLGRDARRRLVHALTAWPLDVVDSRGYNYAEATAGGVALDEIDPSSMRSRICAGLYLVGEMLDVDGRIGGFNFQWAWASGKAAAEGLKFAL